MWKYFGITAFGKAPEGSEGVDAKVDYVIKMLETQRQSENRAVHATVSGPPTFSDAKLMLERLETLAKELGIDLGAWSFDLDKRIIIIHDW